MVHRYETCLSPAARYDPDQPSCKRRGRLSVWSRSIVAFDQVAFEKTCKTSTTSRQLSDNEPCLEDSGGASPQGNAPQVEEASDAMVGGLKDGLFDFGQVQETVDRRHLTHGILGALIAAVDDSRARELYNRLRDVYNPFRPSASLPAPPLEEWRGISAFCDRFQCRCVGGLTSCYGTCTTVCL
ncbi:unnamed protein product [Ectocarpus sp. CCAP 1310/34]|nr:unnamed protein product [Ectocarpus sp. CCAP 1310/34]